MLGDAFPVESWGRDRSLTLISRRTLAWAHSWRQATELLLLPNTKSGSSLHGRRLDHDYTKHNGLKEMVLCEK